MGIWHLLSANNYGYVVVGTSIAFFTWNSRYLLHQFLPKSIKSAENAQTLWKWKNTANSLVHSFISGSWSIINLLRTPELQRDLLNVRNGSTLGVLSFTAGYFIYDLVDLYGNRRAKNRLGLLVHHVLVTICFGLCVTAMKYHGYGMFALLVEINSIFLHIRQLCIIHAVSKDQLFYRVNSFLNLVTFFLFRLLPLGYLTWWLQKNQDEVPKPIVYLGFTTNAIILVLNTIMLWQIITKDYFQFKLKK